MSNYLILDTDIEGSKEEDKIMEICIRQVTDGILIGLNYCSFIRPVYFKDGKWIHNKKPIVNKLICKEVSEYFQDDKTKIEDLSKWVENNIIICHNAPLHMMRLNKELKFWGFKEIPLERFRCSMCIFREIIGKIDPLYNTNYIS